MLTGHVERWRVIEASRLGVNEFLKKPVSGKTLLDRIIAIMTQPRAMVRLGDYYGPEPRKLFFEPLQKVVTPAPIPTAALPAPRQPPALPAPANLGASKVPI
jgi:DNA-binding response OmpR family regulator